MAQPFKNPVLAVKRLMFQMEQAELGNVTEEVSADTPMGDTYPFDDVPLAPETDLLRKQLGNLDRVYRERGVEAVEIAPEIMVLRSQSSFTEVEIESIQTMFNTACALSERGGAPPGTVSHAVFRVMLTRFMGGSTRESNVVADNFFEFLQRGSHLSHITLQALVVGLSPYIKGKLDEQIRACYFLFDLNGDGLISTYELMIMLTTGMLGEFDASDVDMLMRRLTGSIMRRHPEGLRFGAFSDTISLMIRNTAAPCRFARRFAAHLVELHGQDWDEDLAEHVDYRASTSQRTRREATGPHPQTHYRTTTPARTQRNSHPARSARGQTTQRAIAAVAVNLALADPEIDTTKPLRPPSVLFRHEGARSCVDLEFEPDRFPDVDLKVPEVMRYTLSVMRLPADINNFHSIAQHPLVRELSEAALWMVVAKYLQRRDPLQWRAFEARMTPPYVRLINLIPTMFRDTVNELLAFAIAHTIFLCLAFGFRHDRELLSEELKRTIMMDIVRIVGGLVLCSASLDKRSTALFSRKAEEDGDLDAAQAAAQGRARANNAVVALQASLSKKKGAIRSLKAKDRAARAARPRARRVAAPEDAGGSPEPPDSPARARGARRERFNLYGLSPLVSNRFAAGPRLLEVQRSHVVRRSIPARDRGQLYEQLDYGREQLSPERQRQLARRLRELRAPRPTLAAARSDSDLLRDSKTPISVQRRMRSVEASGAALPVWSSHTPAADAALEDTGISAAFPPAWPTGEATARAHLMGTGRRAFGGVASEAEALLTGRPTSSRPDITARTAGDTARSVGQAHGEVAEGSARDSTGRRPRRSPTEATARSHNRAGTERAWISMLAEPTGSPQPSPSARARHSPGAAVPGSPPGPADLLHETWLAAMAPRRDSARDIGPLPSALRASASLPVLRPAAEVAEPAALG